MPPHVGYFAVWGRGRMPPEQADAAGRSSQTGSILGQMGVHERYSVATRATQLARTDSEALDATQAASSPAVWTLTHAQMARRAPALLRGVRMRAARDASIETLSGRGADHHHHLARREGAQLTSGSAWSCLDDSAERSAEAVVDVRAAARVGAIGGERWSARADLPAALFTHVFIRTDRQLSLRARASARLALA